MKELYFMRFLKMLFLGILGFSGSIVAKAQLVMDSVKPIVVEFDKTKATPADVCQGTTKAGSECQQGIEKFATGDIWATLGGFLLNIAQLLSVLAIFLAVLMITYAGVMMVTDDGSGTRFGTGKKIITNAVIGLVIAIMAFTIVYLVASIAGSPTLLQNVFPK